MVEPQRRDDHPVLGFFGHALMAIGALILFLGGLCTLIFAASGAIGLHVRLGDWLVPGSMVALGGLSFGVGLAIHQNLAKARRNG